MGVRKAIVRTRFLVGHPCDQLGLILQGLSEKSRMLHLKNFYSPPFSISQCCSAGVNSQDLGLPGHAHPSTGDSSSGPHPTQGVRAASPLHQQKVSEAPHSLGRSLALQWLEKHGPRGCGWPGTTTL